MGSRKENLKKSLGVTEYPWSSDDEDEVQHTHDDRLPRTSEESRPPVIDPGSSDQPAQPEQVSPGTSRRIQARMDRDLFWSIINNTPRPSHSQPPRTSDAVRSAARCLPQPLLPLRPRLEVRMPETRSTRHRSGADRSPSVDVQRILAFKKLTRSLQNLAQTKAASHSGQRPSASSHSSPRDTRSHDRSGSSRPAGQSAPPRNLFTPAIQFNADTYNYRNPWRRSLPVPPTNVSNLDGVTTDEQQGAHSDWNYTQTDPSQPSTSTDIVIAGNNQRAQNYVNIDNSDDELHTHVPPEVHKNGQNDESNENPEDEANDVEQSHNESGARLIEEVVEVDAPDEVDNNQAPPDVEGNDDATENNTEDNISAGTTVSKETEATQEGSSYQGTKRKRDSNDENQPYSVQEFNQNLLRLLECPVCLEWMEPPISQCRRGHLVCGRCRARLAACPVCRTPFSSVRNRAMEGVAEMLRYPCRHGCGLEVRLRRRGPHEASCGARRYHCPAPPCARHPPLQRDDLMHHFQCKHLPILKIGPKHKFSMKVNSEQHDTWLIMALDEYFHLRVDVDIRTWGVVVYVAYIGPKRNARYFSYEVTVEGQHNSRKLVYTRSTHSDLESSSLNVSRQDCFHLTLDQALNFLRFRNRHCEPDKFLDFDVEITKWDSVDADSRDDSES